MGRQSPHVVQERLNKPLVAERANALNEMNTPLRRKCDQLVRLSADIRTANLSHYYKLGTLCAEIRLNEGEKYGENPMGLIASYMPTQARQMRKTMTFAEAYSKAEFQALVAMVNPTYGNTIHWGHVTYLLTLPSAAARTEWAKKALRNNWDPALLHYEMQRAQGKKDSAHGRKHELPKTLAAQIYQVLRFSGQWLTKSRDVWDGDKISVFANIIEAPPDELTPEMLEDVVNVKRVMKEITKASRENAARVDEVIQHITEVLEAREKEEQRQEDARLGHGKEVRAIDLNGSKRRRRSATTT